MSECKHTYINSGRVCADCGETVGSIIKEFQKHMEETGECPCPARKELEQQLAEAKEVADRRFKWYEDRITELNKAATKDSCREEG